MPYSPREAAAVLAARHPSCTLGVCSFACAVELSDEEAAAGAVSEPASQRRAACAHSSPSSRESLMVSAISLQCLCALCVLLPNHTEGPRAVFQRVTVM